MHFCAAITGRGPIRDRERPCGQRVTNLNGGNIPHQVGEEREDLKRGNSEDVSSY
jgi:hypothetical protein